ncbi:MAG: FliM/FliN family flagellar motor switch protein [Pseudomonadota bacterium]
MAETDEQLKELGASKFGDVPIEITISVGVSRPLIRDLMDIDENSILPLDKGLDDPVELFVGDKLIALGQLEELEGDTTGRLGVRIVEVTVPKPSD